MGKPAAQVLTATVSCPQRLGGTSFYSYVALAAGTREEWIGGSMTHGCRSA